MKLTMRRRTFSSEFDGEVLLDKFQYHDWMISMDPAPIRLQKHIVVHGDNLGKENACPIEYRNVFIKELGPDSVEAPPRPRKATGGPNSGIEKLLIQIDQTGLPKGYIPQKHQDYVDRRTAGLSGRQKARLGQLWAARQRVHPKMPNRGASFVKILEYVAADEQPKKPREGRNR
ncbi:MAG: hypothetical protein ISS72_04785 [Candidatus Brocadiae bacterium]|nr:hypothetical protein [Candidatus Brocadiia bacterium]